MDYSQWGEQAIILDFFKGKVDGTFVDLGAFDGRTGSNTRALAELGWAGVLVEASPFAFVELVKEMAPFPKVQLVNATIMPFNGLTPFFETRSQVSTAETAHKVGEWLKHCFQVAAVTPLTLLGVFGGYFDFVSVDVEGVDLDVIRVLGPLLAGTSLLCYETRRPNRPPEPEYTAAMRSALAGYGFIRIVGETNGGSGNTLIARALGENP